MKEYYEQHKTEFEPTEWLSDKEESLKSNYKVKLYQIQSQDYQQYSNEELQGRWFHACCYGTADDLKKLKKQCINVKDSRMNNYEQGIYTGFCGLMYAILNDNIQAFEFLINDEFANKLDNEQVLLFHNQYIYLMENFTCLHMAALTGNQQFFDMLLKLYENNGIELTCGQSPSSLAIIMNKDISDYQLLEDFKVDNDLFRRAVQFGRVKTIKKLNKFGKVRENKKLFYENVFAKIPQEGEEVTSLDLISNLEANEELGITPQQVATTKNIVKQTIANCLTEMVTDNVLD